MTTKRPLMFVHCFRGARAPLSSVGRAFGCRVRSHRTVAGSNPAVGTFRVLMPPERVRLPPGHRVDHVSPRFHPRHPVPPATDRQPVPLHPALVPQPRYQTAIDSLAHPEPSGYTACYPSASQARNSFRRRKFGAAYIESQGGPAAGQLEEMLRVERTLAQPRVDQMLLERFVIGNALKDQIVDSNIKGNSAPIPRNKSFGPVVFDGNHNTISMSSIVNTTTYTDRSLPITVNESAFSSILTFGSDDPDNSTACPVEAEATKLPGTSTPHHESHLEADISSPHPTILDNATHDDTFNTTETLNISSGTRDVPQAITDSIGHEPCVTFAGIHENEKEHEELLNYRSYSNSLVNTSMETPFRTNLTDHNGYYSNLLSTMRTARLIGHTHSRKNILLDAADSGQSVSNVLAYFGIKPSTDASIYPQSTLPTSKTSQLPPRRSVSSDTVHRRSILLPAPRSLSNSAAHIEAVIGSMGDLSTGCSNDSISDSLFDRSIRKENKDSFTEQSHVTLELGEHSADHKTSIKLIKVSKEDALERVVNERQNQQPVFHKQKTQSRVELNRKVGYVLPSLIDRIPDAVILDALQNSMATPMDAVPSTLGSTSIFQSDLLKKSITKEEQDVLVSNARLALKSSRISRSLPSAYNTQHINTSHISNRSQLSATTRQPSVKPIKQTEVSLGRNRVENDMIPLFVTKYKENLRKVDLNVIIEANQDWNFGNETGGGHRATNIRYNKRSPTFTIRKGDGGLTDVPAETPDDSLSIAASTSAPASSAGVQSNAKTKDNPIESFINARRSARFIEKGMVTQPMSFDHTAGEFLYSELSNKIGKFSHEMAALHKQLT